MPIPRLAATTLAALALAGATANAQQPAHVTRDLAATGGTVFTTVLDIATGDDLVLGRDSENGSVTSSFGGGFPAAAVTATPLRTVYVVGTDAAVRVYTPSASGFQLADTWQVVSPVVGQTLAPTAIAPARDGVLVAFGAPGGFRGVVALDDTGRAVATWSVPDETVPAGVTPSPESISVIAPGRFVVHVPPCRGSDCAGEAPDGHAYGLTLSTPSGAPATLSTTTRWQGAVLAQVGDLAAGSTASFLATAPSSPGAQLVGVLLTPSGGAVATGAVRTVSAPPTRVSATGEGPGGTAYVLEGPGSGPAVIQAFDPRGAGWAPVAGPAWVASWGPAGPPEPLRCDGRPATIAGTPGDDVLRGTPRTDVIVALGGDDVVRGGGGADFICLGPGADSASGGPGADLILGGRGRDRLAGGAGPDLIGGGPGRDRAAGDAGRDRCRAEAVADCEL